jgi:NADPH-dependent curcumin reductase CurA
MQAVQSGQGPPVYPTVSGYQSMVANVLILDSMTNRRIVLASRPVGEPTEENFRLESEETAPPAEGQVLLKTMYLSLDPYMRGRMSDAPSYVAPFEIGAPLSGGTVCEVVESEAPEFQPGDVVQAFSGWQEYSVVPAKGLRKLDPAAAPVSTALGVLGMPGMTAYMGLLRLGTPKAGETVVVGAAAGAVGSVVGQIAKIKGCRAVGIAGGPEKCEFVVKELGFDACVDHRSETMAEDLKAACPSGIDVYFENIGGKMFDAVLPLMNNFGRIPLCGLIAGYNATKLPDGPDQTLKVMAFILKKRLKIQGFIVSDFNAEAGEFQRDMAAWIHDGKVQYREDIVEGVENAPAAMIGLLKGKNFGKQLVKF